MLVTPLGKEEANGLTPDPVSVSTAFIQSSDYYWVLISGISICKVVYVHLTRYSIVHYSNQSAEMNIL